MSTIIPAQLIITIDTYVDCGDDQRLVLQALHNLGVALGEVPGEVYACVLVPSADLDQPVLLQLDDLQLETGAEAALVELYPPRQPLHLDLQQWDKKGDCGCSSARIGSSLRPRLERDIRQDSVVLPRRHVLSCLRSESPLPISALQGAVFCFLLGFDACFPPYQFHVVDEGVSVLPGLGSVARERPRRDLLRVVEIVEGLGEEVHRVVDERSLRLQKQSFPKSKTEIVRHTCKYLHLCTLW